MQIKKRAIWVAVLVVAVGLPTAFWAQSNLTGGTEAPRNQKGQSEATPPDSEASTRTEPGLKENIRARHSLESESFDNVSNSGQQVERLADIDSLDHTQAISNMIESAFAGSIEDAAKIIEYARSCIGTAPDEDSLRVSLNMRAEDHQLPLRLSTGILGGTQAFNSFGEWSAEKWRRFNNCNETKNLFGDDFFARLREQAESGDVLARFLYAMLEPQGPRGHTDGILVWLEYLTLAYDFTAQNMSEREPLGLLAFGLSLRDLGLFTPIEPVVGDAFLIAAERCGAPQVLLDGIALPMTSGIFERAWADSEVIVREFCR